MIDHLWFGGEDHPPPDEWIDFVLLTEIYIGLHPDEIDDLPSDRVNTDLLLYTIREERKAELRRK